MIPIIQPSRNWPKLSVAGEQSFAQAIEIGMNSSHCPLLQLQCAQKLLEQTQQWSRNDKRIMRVYPGLFNVACKLYCICRAPDRRLYGHLAARCRTLHEQKANRPCDLVRWKWHQNPGLIQPGTTDSSKPCPRRGTSEDCNSLSLQN